MFMMATAQVHKLGWYT